MIRNLGRFPMAFASVSAALVACTTSAIAQDPAAFYKGRNIDLIVASPPGGGFDAYARIITQYMGKYMPAAPNFIIRNMPGAGARNATTYLADVGARDGSVILATQPGALVEQILGDPGKIAYDPLSFQYIGSAESFTSLCLLRTDSNVKSYKELHEKEAVFGGNQIGSTTHDHPLMFKNLSNAKIKLISGYKGTADLVLAVKRKELDGFCGYAWSSLFARSADLIEDKVVRIINQLGLKPHPEAAKAGVPMALDFVKDPENRKAMELITTVQEFGRPYLVHADVPEDRVAALRKAFDQTMADKDYIAAIKKAKLDVSPRTGDEVTELLRRVIQAPKAIQDKARWAISHR